MRNVSFLTQKAIFSGIRVPEDELFIKVDASCARVYAKEVIKGRWLEAEPWIKINPPEALIYAHDIIKGRWLDAEPYLMIDDSRSCIYARDVIKGRWLEAEPYLLASGYVNSICFYAMEVIQDRWLEGEKVIREKNGTLIPDYLEFLRKKKYNVKTKIQWLKEENFSDNIFDLLNKIGMQKEVQEWIILNHPNLIKKIENLPLSLREKYQHELSLSGIEI